MRGWRLAAMAGSIGVIAVTAWLVFGHPALAPSPVPLGSDSITVDLQSELPHSVTLPPQDCHADHCQAWTAWSALQKLAAADTIALQANPSTGLGVFVTSIAGLTNGQGGRYWVYEVNEHKVAVASDQQQLQPGDHLVWKFVIPDGY